MSPITAKTDCVDCLVDHQSLRQSLDPHVGSVKSTDRHSGGGDGGA